MMKASHVNEEQNPEQQPATSAFLTKWLNKLTSLLSKRVREFLTWVIEACRRRRPTSEKRAYIN